MGTRSCRTVSGLGLFCAPASRSAYLERYGPRLAYTMYSVSTAGRSSIWPYWRAGLRRWWCWCDRSWVRHVARGAARSVRGCWCFRRAMRTPRTWCVRASDHHECQVVHEARSVAIMSYRTASPRTRLNCASWVKGGALPRTGTSRGRVYGNAHARDDVGVASGESRGLLWGARMLPARKLPSGQFLNLNSVMVSCSLRIGTRLSFRSGEGITRRSTPAARRGQTTG